MTTTPFLEQDQEDADAPPFGELLMQATATPRERAAVWALVEEAEILSLDTVRRNLVCQSGERIEFTWQHLSCSLYGLGLDESGRSFIDLVLSLAGPHQTSLTRVADLGNRRLGIVLQAMTHLVDNDTIAIATRL
jgi:hypothetical protein